jgi:hypothetical protein
VDKQGNSTYLTIDPLKMALQATKSTKIIQTNIQKPCEITQHHRKTSNVTEMKHKSREQTPPESHKITKHLKTIAKTHH